MIGCDSWAVVEFREKGDNILRHKRLRGKNQRERSFRPLTVYGVINVNREGWCVLTASFHTLEHVLRNHDMNIEDIQEYTTCDLNCTLSYGKFIPRVRPLIYRHTYSIHSI